MRICSKCEQEKSLIDFNKNKRKKDGLQRYCKECNKSFLKRHYQNNKDYYKRKNKKNKEKRKIWWKNFKSKLECKECGENHPATFDFHHTQNNKEYNVSRMVIEGMSTKRILEEIKKCVVLCANCHRKLHNGVKESK